MAPQLIIWDLYGTILKADVPDGIVRTGFEELWDAYPHAKKVLFTDGEPLTVKTHLQLSGLHHRFDSVYDSRHCIDRVYFQIQNERFKQAILERGGGTLKNLGRACEELEVPISETVFIGDNFYGRDLTSANAFGVRFIRVPQFRTKNPPLSKMLEQAQNTKFESPKRKEPFSFASLIGTL